MNINLRGRDPLVLPSQYTCYFRQGSVVSGQDTSVPSIFYGSMDSSTAKVSVPIQVNINMYEGVPNLETISSSIIQL